MKIERLETGGIAILHPKGSLMGNKEMDDLRAGLETLGKEGNTKAVIDLSQVNYINSTGIGVLIAGYKDYSSRSGKLKLCGLSNSLENVLVITKLTQVFEVYPNLKEALASFAG